MSITLETPYPATRLAKVIGKTSSVPTQRVTPLAAPARFAAPAAPTVTAADTGGPIVASSINLAPATLDIAGIRAGDRNLIQMTLLSAGVPTDLTGLTLTAQARAVATDSVASLTAEIVITDATGGIFTMQWDGDDVRTLLDATASASWKGVWDLQLGTEPDAVTVVAGAFSVDLDVTR